MILFQLTRQEWKLGILDFRRPELVARKWFCAIAIAICAKEDGFSIDESYDAGGAQSLTSLGFPAFGNLHDRKERHGVCVLKWQCGTCISGCPAIYSRCV
jgi:hypothetical protein